jgi:hypothetical protein
MCPKFSDGGGASALSVLLVTTLRVFDRGRLSRPESGAGLRPGVGLLGRALLCGVFGCLDAL